ncbi:MAG: hypothetical protein NTW96_24850 [Planctomycetia bacterium]|nr:hypothetical protein [Planctomycetia bacterium]
MTKPSATPDRSISALEVYTVAEACARLRWGRKTFWHAERMGLKSVSFGRSKYLRGAEILRWFCEMEQPATEGTSDE